MEIVSAGSEENSELSSTAIELLWNGLEAKDNEMDLHESEINMENSDAIANNECLVNSVQNDETAAESIHLSITDDAVSALSTQSLNVTAITLPDGTTALFQSEIDDECTSENSEAKYIKARAVQLEDGTTAYIPIGDFQKLSADESCDKSEEMKLNALLEQHASEIQDGDVTTLIQSNEKSVGEMETVELTDGAAAYLSSLTGSQIIASRSTSQPDIDLDAFVAQKVSVPNSSMVDVPVSCILAGSGTKDFLSFSSGISDDKQYKCTVENCNEVFGSLQQFKTHSRKHKATKSFKCNICEKLFPTKHGMKSHLRVHSGEKPYKCIYHNCVKAFKTSSDLQKHHRTHTGERPFKCLFEGCDRSFTTSNIRKVHMRVHTGERPYVCNVTACGKTFSSATNYKNHMRIHTGEKPYLCTFPKCQRRFTEYSSLYKHHIVHSMAKPYTCEICGKNYRQTSTLATHRRTYHRVVETALPVDQSAVTLNLDGELELQDADKFLGDANIILTKPGGEVRTFNTLQTEAGISVFEVTDQCADGNISELTGEHKDVIMSTINDETAENIISIVDSDQQIYVLADPSQLALLQQQVADGQLVTTIPIDQIEAAAQNGVIIDSSETIGDMKHELC